MLQAELLVMSGKHSGTIIPLPDGKFLIGREEDCHLRPNSDLVSRHHCVFTVDDFTVRLRDLGSTNGTLVNGERIRGGVVLNSGDIVSIGKIELRVIVKTPDQDTVSNIVVESKTGLFKKDADLTVSPTASSSEAPSTIEGSSGEISIVSQTVYELPTADMASQVPAGQVPVPQQFQNPPTGDTQLANPMGMPMAPQMGYPQMGYPQMMPYGFPGYPQMYGQPMGYPQMPPGYPQMGMPVAPEAPVEAPSTASISAPEIKLPDPSQTGAKAPAPKPAAPPAGEGQSAEAKAKEEAPKRAEDIIQQYLKRRPTSGDSGKK
ncbi:MAG TPA: FHA domain-containing protein [Planctomicrobium sp.]|nr:FHA domain-containing protein [Planctomicrobium sp.]